MLLRVRLTPKSAMDRVEGRTLFGDGEALAVKVRAPPHEGEANAALIRCLASATGLPKGAFTLETGARGRLKMVAATGEPGRLAEALERLAALP
ncbi:DUF167 family protein [Aureimonas psammosilenae]|uniref:DUF167 family protein n=1 Tax=Aureimonas psammosilenae TaxID=2495496 RepID=UPI001F2B3212|nr:DUF167 family protein [Aureimonas psammosilenae]